MTDVSKDVSIDYSSRSFSTMITIDEHDYPIAFQTEFFPSGDAMHPTGRMIVLLAHPEHGNIVFYMRHEDHHWQLDLPTYKDVRETDPVTIQKAYSFTLHDSLLVWCDGTIHSFHA
jgi:hypothetical protein